MHRDSATHKRKPAPAKAEKDLWRYFYREGHGGMVVSDEIIIKINGECSKV